MFWVVASVVAIIVLLQIRTLALRSYTTRFIVPTIGREFSPETGNYNLDVAPAISTTLFLIASFEFQGPVHVA
jgi:hypothetical protein